MNTKDGKGTTTCCSQNPIGFSQPSHTKATGNPNAFSNIYNIKPCFEYLSLKQREASRKEFDQLIANAKEMNVNNIRTLCLFALNFGTKMSEEDKQRHVRFRHIFYTVFLFISILPLANSRRSWRCWFFKTKKTF